MDLPGERRCRELSASELAGIERDHISAAPLSAAGWFCSRDRVPNSCYHRRSMRNSLRLFVNGSERQVSAEHAFLTLSTWLRDVEHATGTKVVCEEGDCGACTVLVAFAGGQELKYLPLNSCIQLMAQLDAAHVVTVEGVSRNGALSAIQQQMVDHHGAQCGYCTPGFICAMTALAEEKSSWTPADVREALTGNLCRCTGYISIIEAAMAASGASGPSLAELYPSAPIASRLRELAGEDLLLESDGRRFFAPASLAEAVRIKAAHPGAVILQGGTDLGVLANKRAFTPPVFLSLRRVPGLDEVAGDGAALRVGANVTLARLERETLSAIPQLNEMLRIFGSPQIRNAGTVVGNIANGSPISDLLPFLFVSGASIEAVGSRGPRTIAIDALYRGYKTLDLAPDEIITSVVIPLPRPDETLRLYKVTRRRDLDISAFGAAIRLKTDGHRISTARIAYGGVAPTVVRLPRTEAFLEGSELTEATFATAGEHARAEVKPISDVRGSAAYRAQLAENILLKFYREIAG